VNAPLFVLDQTPDFLFGNCEDGPAQVGGNRPSRWEDSADPIDPATRRPEFREIQG
jgi:hypothetical protein